MKKSNRENITRTRNGSQEAIFRKGSVVYLLLVGMILLFTLGCRSKNGSMEFAGHGQVEVTSSPVFEEYRNPNDENMDPQDLIENESCEEQELEQQNSYPASTDIVIAEPETTENDHSAEATKVSDEVNSQTSENPSCEKIEFLAAHEISCGDRDRQIVIMTYDDGGKEEYIQHIMAVYEQFGCRTTFFLTGEWVDRNHDLAREMIDRGFEIGCHGWDHTAMTKLSHAAVRKQIEDFLALMQEIAPDYEIKFIRFPYGSRNQCVREIAAEYGLQSVMWTHGSGGFDESTIDNIMRELDWGSLILSHSTRWYDVYSTEEILASLLDQGYQVVTLSEGMADSDRYQK